ncbi:hypothetical protein Tco_1168221 [Tanacetum coccineum]
MHSMKGYRLFDGGAGPEILQNRRVSLAPTDTNMNPSGSGDRYERYPETAANTNVSHMTQWENARLEAEARLVHGSRVVSNFYQHIHTGSAPDHINKSCISSLSVPQPLCFDVLKAWQGLTLY